MYDRKQQKLPYIKYKCHNTQLTSVGQSAA